MSSIKPTTEHIIARGKIFELVQLPQPDGRVFERARRAPGVRIIIHDKPAGSILLTREFRQELQAWDYRLPGGKVFDSLAEYQDFRSSKQDILAAATSKAVAEAREETGIILSDPQFVRKSTLGATVEWDLFVFEARTWTHHELGQQLEAGEQIQADVWFTYQAAQTMILQGKLQEERIALILLQWLNQQ